jgi:hypothetical protein
MYVSAEKIGAESLLWESIESIALLLYLRKSEWRRAASLGGDCTMIYRRYMNAGRHAGETVKRCVKWTSSETARY